MLRVPKTPIVCCVTDRRSLGGPRGGAGLRDAIQKAVQAGADWVQVREKDMPARELLELVRGAVKSAEALGRASLRVIVNDRLDVALAAGAAGVHLGGESLHARDVVAWRRGGNAPGEFLVGVSCHSLEQAREAESAGVSYIFFGPVFETPSKRAFGEPQGVPRLAEICRSVRVPVVAIGGVDENNAPECVRAGAAGIAAIRMFQEARDADALKSAVQKIHRSVG
ncbi:MAG: thiamine phosphate synthase [Candidatus Acidiferrales bacterium]